MQVRRLRAGDAGLALEAIRSLKTRGASAAPSARYLAKFLSRSENVLIVATEGATPVGFLVAYTLDRVDRNQQMVCLYEIGVSESHRQRGIGRAMVDVLKSLCKRQDALKMWVSTNRANLEAVRLYEGTGGVADVSGDEVTYTYRPESFT